MWRRKFIGLLPEVNRRRLYEKRSCQSIFEFAAKFAGISERHVREVLNLDERFVDKPTLHEALVSGSLSVNKLARVASIATSENEHELAEKVKLLPQRAMDTLVRDQRFFERENGSNKALFEPKSLCAQRFKLSDEVVEKLNHLLDQGKDVNAILIELLEQREGNIERAKAEWRGITTKSRYIPAQVRRILKDEFGQKCSIASCQKPAKEIHHTQRFSLSHSHDPHYLAPLCREHHQLAHTVDVRVRAHWR